MYDGLSNLTLNLWCDSFRLWLTQQTHVDCSTFSNEKVRKIAHELARDTDED